jgi:hypothetical protein
MTLPPGANARQNVQIGWHSSTKSFLIVWDEKSGSDVNIRGTMLNENFVSLGPDFELVGGPGTQSAVRMASRAAGKGYVFSYSTQTTNGAPTKIRFVDHSGSSQLSFELIPDGQTSTSSTLWYDQGLERGVVQWLGSDGTYHQALFSETGPVGSPLALDGLGGVVGAVVGAPEKNSLRAVFMAGGVVKLRSIDAKTGYIFPGSAAISNESPVDKIIGGVTHPMGYAIVLWSGDGKLYRRMLAP